jgi:hypothetical protein
MDGFAALQIVRLDQIERRARNTGECATREGNTHRMLRAARLEKSAYDKSMAIVAAEVTPVTSFD